MLDKRQRYSQSIAFWSFAAGVEGQFFDSDVLHFGRYLKYNFLDSKEILQEISFQDSPLHSAGGSTEGLGLGFRVYFDFLCLMNKKNTGE